MGTLEKILEEIEAKKKGCLDVIKTEVDPMEITIHREQYKGMRKAENVIRKYLNDGWIPVEERLPEDEEMVLVTCKTKVGRLSVYRAWRGGGYWHGTGSISDVIAWQPLPEPYRPEESRE